MRPRSPSSIGQRVDLIRLKIAEGQTHRQAAATLGYSRGWTRKWLRRYRQRGLSALGPPPARAPHPLARFSPAVAQAARAYRQTHPLVGARRVLLALAKDPALAGARLPDARTLHRFFVAEGFVAPRLPRDQRPAPAAVAARGDPHAVWQIDHQDHLALAGLDELTVLQSIRAPQAGLAIGADLFAGPRGAHGVPLDAFLDALRQRIARWGKPQVLQVDHAPLFLGQPQRQFPSRFELFCAGLGIGVRPIRPGRPTDNGGVERQHRIADGVLLGPTFADRAAAQAELDAHLDALNRRFPSRAPACAGQPPLVACPDAHHSGRPYDPAHEWAEFDLDAVDRLLAQWRWYRTVGQRTGQISFDDARQGVGKAYRGQMVILCFDPADRQVVIHRGGATLADLGPEIRRFRCAAFEQATILGCSQIAGRPVVEQEATRQ